MLTGRTVLSTGNTPDNVRTCKYKEQLLSLPQHVQDLADLTFKAFVANPFDPSLERHDLNDTKKGRHRNGSFAVSITRRYRAIATIDGGVNVWYWIGSHEDYNNFTGSK